MFRIFLIAAVLLSAAPMVAMANGPDSPPQDADVNEDTMVNIFDLVILGYSYGDPASDTVVVPQTTATGGPITTQRLDLNWSGKVDLADLQIAADQFGMTAPQVDTFIASLAKNEPKAVAPRGKLASTWGKIKRSVR